MNTTSPDLQVIGPIPWIHTLLAHLTLAPLTSKITIYSILSNQSSLSYVAHNEIMGDNEQKQETTLSSDPAANAPDAAAAEIAKDKGKGKARVEEAEEEYWMEEDEDEESSEDEELEGFVRPESFFNL